MSIVVGWRRVQAGTQPLNMNIAPSFFIEVRIICIVDLPSPPEALKIRLCITSIQCSVRHDVSEGRTFKTSAGEQTVVATVPCSDTMRTRST